MHFLAEMTFLFRNERARPIRLTNTQRERERGGGGEREYRQGGRERERERERERLLAAFLNEAGCDKAEAYVEKEDVS